MLTFGKRLVFLYSVGPSFIAEMGGGKYVGWLPSAQLAALTLFI